MILKELDEIQLTDKLSKAGRAAEEQVAFYLRRAFKDEAAVNIFNGLRLERDGDAAQIDHLVLHRYGAIVIESKSVTTRVEVNEHGEWKRWFDGTWKGMPSPIQQAKQQGIFLGRYLEAHAEVLLGKILGLQTHFGAMHLDHLIAISDNGIINRPKQDSLEPVCKADQITDKVKALLQKYRKANSPFSFNFKDGMYSFNEDEFTKISNFLLHHHQPIVLKPIVVRKPDKPLSNPPLSTHPQKLAQAARPKPADKQAELCSTVSKPRQLSKPQQTCRHCRSDRLSVVSGRYGYYFKCGKCDGSTSIEAACFSCGAKLKIRKRGNQFYAECLPCNNSEAFFTNLEV
jgi:hypothetical protein